MTIQVALLRAVNVAGRNQVAMSDLRELCESLGLVGAKTLLQSGNVVFRGRRGSASRLEEQLTAETEQRLGVATDYFVRTAAQWQAIVDGNPFTDEAKRDPGHLVVMCLKATPHSTQVRALQTAIQGAEYLLGQGRELYIVYPDGIGRSKLTTALIEKTLGVRGTGRNWNTVLKLAAMCRDFA